MTKYLARQVAVGFVASVIMVVTVASFGNTHFIAATITLTGTAVLFTRLVRVAQKLDDLRESIRSLGKSFTDRIYGYSEEKEDEHDQL